ncbi:hypothetical protein KKG41_02230 [Patescibacteria group bacterium]|nr:hypothetical protein [Patescibacteria group bacterium]MBU1890542.1 hypothetical protein [Patescibacteria group bacterium]
MLRGAAFLIVVALLLIMVHVAAEPETEVKLGDTIEVTVKSHLLKSGQLEKSYVTSPGRLHRPMNDFATRHVETLQFKPQQRSFWVVITVGIMRTGEDTFRVMGKPTVKRCYNGNVMFPIGG